MELTKIGLLLAKLESAYGTDPVPTGSANVIETIRGAVNFSPNFTHLSRQIMEGSFSRASGLNVLPEVTLSFSVEVRGNRTTGGTDTDISSGAISEALKIDPLLQACGLEPTYTAEGSNGARDGYVTYKPLNRYTAVGQAVTFYFYSGAKLHKIHGAIGNVKGTLEAGQIGKLDFEFKGLYGDVCDADFPSTGGTALRAVAVNAAGSNYVVGDILSVAGGTAATTATVRVTRVSDAGGVTAVKVLKVGWYSVNPTLTGNSVTGGTGTSCTLNLTMMTLTDPAFLNVKPPLFVSSSTTIGSLSPIFSKIDFDLGNQIVRREDANSTNGIKGFLIVDQDAKLTIDPESNTETLAAYFNDLELASSKTITASLGVLVGNRFQCTFIGTPMSVGYGDRNGNRTQPITYAIERATLDATAGGEFALKFY